ncbi:ABC transporter permease [Carboxylicivirga caseinilyticus]|uniref:ABC transporter permease n=1 Tax=Carboxylicivirga caseinilyticus TaxID=3417572 RepID=UPI003D3282BA|nr:ABC transporter permease [Marinilabiliaceae bacterium A049]
MMLKHHIKVALRNIRKQGFYSFLNILSLSVGITLSLLVLLLVKHELSYDKSFNQSESIYRVATKGILSSNFINSATSPMPLGDLMTKYDEVESVVRFVPGANNVVSNEDVKFNEEHFRFADASFFEIFDLDIIAGESESLLKSPNSVVLTKSAANKYFGEQNPIGKIITRANMNYKVTGICEDMPVTSHFKFNFLASISTIDAILLKKADTTYVQNWKKDWLYLNCYTYIKLKPTVESRSFEENFNKEKDALLLPQVKETLQSELSTDSIKLDFYLQPITDIHLHSHLTAELQPNSKPVYINLFIFIAVFILLTTCINFINLTTAKARRRFNEVALRQMVGAGRRQLVWQFLTEAILYSLSATFFGLVLLELLIPFFNFFFNLQLNFSILTGWIDFFWILMLVLFVSIMSGAFPAFFFSGLKPKHILQGNYRIKNNGLLVRGIFVCAQIAISIFLLIVVTGMWWQISYINQYNPGFDSKNIMVIERGGAIGKNYQNFKSDLLKINGIESVSACSSLPGDDYFQGTFKIKNGANEKVAVLPMNYVDRDYFTMLNLTLKTGRFLDEAEGDSLGILLNHTAITEYDIKKPLGQKIEVFGNKDFELNVVGVVKDFHFETYYEKIKPLALILMGEKMNFDYILVKLNAQHSVATSQLINETWKKYSESSPFEWQMLTTRLSNLYEEDIRIAKIISVFAILSLFMTILGIIALTAFITEYKSKDIGIKKVLGISRQSIILQIFSDFSLYIIIGVILSILPAFIALTAWIESYAYARFLNGFIFILDAVFVAGLAYLSVFYQSYRMASERPADSWQYK